MRASASFIRHRSAVFSRRLHRIVVSQDSVCDGSRNMRVKHSSICLTFPAIVSFHDWIAFLRATTSGRAIIRPAIPEKRLSVPAGRAGDSSRALYRILCANGHRRLLLLLRFRAALAENALGAVSGDQSLNPKYLHRRSYCLVRSGSFVDEIVAMAVGINQVNRESVHLRAGKIGHSRVPS